MLEQKFQLRITHFWSYKWGVPHTEWYRKAVFGLYYENEQVEKFIIELQHVAQLYVKDGNIFYTSFPIQEQAPKGID